MVPVLDHARRKRRELRAALAGAALAMTESAKTAPEYYQEATRALERGDYREAIAIAESGFEAYPYVVEFQHNIALWYAHHLNDGAAAERHYRKALEAKADFAPSILNLSGLLLDRGALAEAEELLVAALRKDRSRSGLHYNLACARARRNDVAGAVEALTQAIHIKPESQQQAAADSAFDQVRADPRFRALLAERVLAPNLVPSYLPSRFTTPPAPVDVGARFPELRSRARQCVRLHPRQRGPLPARSSRLGGRFLNNHTAWPACPEHHTPCAGILQLLAEGMPGLALPPGAAAAQLFWCPRDHDSVDYVPRVVMRFLAENELEEPHGDNPPLGEVENEDYLPAEC